MISAFFALMLLAPPQQDYEVGIAWIKNSAMIQDTYNGLRETLRSLAPNIHMEVVEDQLTNENLRRTLKRYVDTKKAIILLGSQAAVELNDLPKEIPAFFGTTYDPVSLGLVQSMEHPGGHITGSTYTIAPEERFLIINRILPHTKKITLLVLSNHPGGIIEQRETAESCRKHHIELETYFVSSMEEAKQRVRETDSDVIIIGSQGFLNQNGGQLQNETPKPIISYPPGPVQEGALASFASDNYVLGRLLAHNVIAVLNRGEPIEKVPVRADPAPKLLINVSTAERLGLDIPYRILKAAQLIE